MTKLKTIFDNAKDFYFNRWRGSEKVAPAFGEKVYITRLVWNHITKHPRRLLVDKIIRLKKLSLAKEVLETSTTYQTVQKRGEIYYYGFRAIKENTVAKIVVTSKGKSGKKFLYSVMFKNISRAKQKEIDRHNKRLVIQFKRQGLAGAKKRE